MMQLVGSRCARCLKVIPSILDGEFCADCGNPVHKKCKLLSPGDGAFCRVCGAEINTPVALQVRTEREAQEEQMNSPQLPAVQVRVNRYNFRLNSSSPRA